MQSHLLILVCFSTRQWDHPSTEGNFLLAYWCSYFEFYLYLSMLFTKVYKLLPCIIPQTAKWKCSMPAWLHALGMQQHRRREGNRPSITACLLYTRVPLRNLSLLWMHTCQIRPMLLTRLVLRIDCQIVSQKCDVIWQ